MLVALMRKLDRLIVPFRCQLCRRVSGVVFISIMLVEAVILVPSYFSYRDDLVERLMHAGEAALAATLRPQAHSRVSDILIAGRMIVQDGPVMGAELYGPEGSVGHFGEAPQATLAGLGGEVRWSDDGQRIEMSFPGNALGAHYDIVARLDASWIGPELTAFVWRIAGLVLLISVVVCAAAMMILGRTSMGPMLALRDHLAWAYDNPSIADAKLFRTGNDEWRDVGAAVNRLLARVARTYREDLAMMTAMADQASDAIVAYDSDNRVVYANTACRELVGCESTEQMEASGLPRLRTAHDEQSRTLPEAIKDGVRGVEVVVEGRDGRQVPCLIQAAQLDSQTGGTLRCYAHLTDISQLRAAHERLMQQNIELEAANRAKSEFLANVSHELRTPLNAIIGFSELLRDQAFRDDPDSRFREYAEDIQMSGRHLLSLINDILDLSKIEAGCFELEETELDVDEVIDASLRLVRGRREAQVIDLRVEVPTDMPTLVADIRAVKQILINILSNAVKFTPAGGRVTVSARRTETGGLQIAVADTGEGMDPELVSQAFQPFRQLDGDLHRRFEGTGLGLPLVRSLAEMHGAEVEVDTALGEGTRIAIQFPAARCRDSGQPTRGEAMSAAS